MFQVKFKFAKKNEKDNLFPKDILIQTINANKGGFTKLFSLTCYNTVTIKL